MAHHACNNMSLGFTVICGRVALSSGDVVFLLRTVGVRDAARSINSG